MPPIDLYAGWPSARRSDDELELDAADQRRLDRNRPTDLYDARWRQDARKKAKLAAERRAKADSGLVAKLLSGLLMGRLVGLDVSPNEFADLYAGFATTLQQLGLTVNPRALTPNSVNKSDACYLAARTLGVSPEGAGRVQPVTPRSRRKFDEFLAMFSESPTLADAVQAGTQDGIPIGVMELVSAMVGALKAAVRANDIQAIRLVGEDFGAMAAALAELTGGPMAQRRTRASGSPMVEVEPGRFVDFELCERDPETGKPRLKANAVASRKTGDPRGKVTSIRLGDEDVETKNVDSREGKLVKRGRSSGIPD